MSFSSEVKNELALTEVRARHCLISELTALVIFLGRIKIAEAGSFLLVIQTENVSVAKRFDFLVSSLLKEAPEAMVRRNKNKGKMLYLLILEGERAKRLLTLTKIIDRNLETRERLSMVTDAVAQSSCCRRAFIRGAFLSAGSISDPEKGYHFEIVTMDEERAGVLQGMLESFGLNPKIVKRKNHYPVYVKEGEQLSEVLGLMQASRALIKYEQTRVVRDVRNRVNRNVNLETANLNKTARAAGKHALDILYIKDTKGLYSLEDSLSELAELRLLHMEASLKELGEMLSTPLGKSGVNHRLNKISEIADEMRREKGEL